MKEFWSHQVSFSSWLSKQSEHRTGSTLISDITKNLAITLTALQMSSAEMWEAVKSITALEKALCFWRTNDLMFVAVKHGSGSIMLGGERSPEKGDISFSVSHFITLCSYGFFLLSFPCDFCAAQGVIWKRKIPTVSTFSMSNMTGNCRNVLLVLVYNKR